MSLIIALKDRDRFILGADKQVSTGDNCGHSCTKIWDVEELPNAVFGSVGSLRASQVVKYNKFLDFNAIMMNGVDTSFVINSLVPSLVMLLKENGVLPTVDENESCKQLMLPNSFLFACDDKAWMIWHDLSVTEIDDYFAIGSGSDVANGALYATKHSENPFERITTAIDAAAETTLFVDHGIDLVATMAYDEDDALVEEAFNRNTKDKLKAKVEETKARKAAEKEAKKADKKAEKAVDKKAKKAKKDSNKATK